MRKDKEQFLALNAYLGCEVPRAFFLRWQAMAEIRGIDKRVLLARAIESDLIREEKKLDDKKVTAYNALLEIKARQNGFYMKDLVAPLEVKKTPRGEKMKVAKPPSWPKIKKS